MDLQERTEGNVGLVLHGIRKASRIHITAIILVVGIDKLAAYLPDICLEFVLKAILFELVQHIDFFRIGIERGPDVVMDRDHHLATKVFSHTKHIGGRDLVRDTDSSK